MFDAAVQEAARLHLADGIGQAKDRPGKTQPLWEGDPRQVGRYRLVSRLGAGGMGEVYVGRSPAGRAVAVKLMHPSLASKPAFRERFAREAAAAEQVGGAFTAAVVEYDAQASRPWLATVFVPAMSLGEAVTELGPLPEDATAVLGAGLVEALEAIHKAGITHRDLKPSNVLLAADGPKVIDFGIAAAAEDAALTTTGSVLGTFGYLPPERLLGDRKDTDLAGEGDVFALGAVLAFTVTGRNPFGSDAAEMAYRTVHAPPQLDGVPTRLRQVVEKCLAKDPKRRPGLTALLEELLTVASSKRTAGGAVGTGWLPPAVAAMVLRYAQVQGPVAAAVDERPAGAAEAGPAQPQLAEPGPAELLEQQDSAPLTPHGLSHGPGPEDGRPFESATERGRPVSRRRLLTGAAALGGAGLAGGFGGAWLMSDRPDARSAPRPRKLWSFQAANGIWSSPAVADGVVYVGCSDGRLYAVDAATGRQGWSYQTGAEVNSSPAVADGVVYFGSWDDSLYAVDASTGKERWTYRTGNQVDSSPTVADGVVYVGSWDGQLHAVDAVTGRQHWAYRTGGKVLSSPTATGGTVYVGSEDASLHAVDAATGRQRWTYRTGGKVNSSPTVADGVVYVGSWDGQLHALDAVTGRQHWTYRTGGKVLSSPTATGGTVYVGSEDASLHAVDAATGRQHWTYRTRKRAFQRDNQVLSSPSVAAGTVYVGGYNRCLYAVDAATGKQRWSFQTDGPVASSPAVADGVVYVGSLDGCLYAFRGTRL